MDSQPFPSEGVDVERANAARMYDYYLGGFHNFAVDREQAERVIAAYPGARASARANRVFLGNAVRWCVNAGIDQFLDLGSGVPTAGNVHEIAHAANPDARIAYVDFEPVAVAHARELVTADDIGNVTVTWADVREPRSVLSSPGVADFLDFSRSIAVLMVAVLHFVHDEDVVDRGGVGAVVASYVDAVVPGSVLVLSHTSADVDDPEQAAGLRTVIDSYQGSATGHNLRDRGEIRAILEPVDLVEPGLVDVSEWPEPGTVPGPAGIYGGIGRVRGRS